MSLPSFPNVDPPIHREDAVNQILSSIAMSHPHKSRPITPSAPTAIPPWPAPPPQNPAGPAAPRPVPPSR